MLKKFLILFCVAFIGACSSFDGDGLTNGSYSQGKQLDPNCDHYAFGGSGGDCTPAGQWHLKDKQGQSEARRDKSDDFLRKMKCCFIS